MALASWKNLGARVTRPEEVRGGVHVYKRASTRATSSKHIDARVETGLVVNKRGSRRTGGRKGGSPKRRFSALTREKQARGRGNFGTRTCTLRAGLTVFLAAADLVVGKGGWYAVSGTSMNCSRGFPDIAARTRARCRGHAGEDSGRAQLPPLYKKNAGTRRRIAGAHGRATHLNCAWTPANWWVAREEAIATFTRGVTALGKVWCVRMKCRPSAVSRGLLHTRKTKLPSASTSHEAGSYAAEN